MKYIFLDIDGTLFDHEKYAVPESAYRAAELARNAGHKIFICTGRSCCLLEHVEGIAWDGVVAAAGAYAEAEGKIIYEDSIEDGELQSIMQLCRSKDTFYILEGKKRVYMHPVMSEFFFVGEGKNNGSAYKYFKQRAICEMDAYDPQEDVIYKFCLYTRVPGAFQEIEEKLGGRYQFVYSMSDQGEMRSVEVISKKNNKAGGVKKILEYYGGSMEDTVAVGDSMNDLEMIQECGIGIVMGNGSEQLKPYADYVTSDIGEDGVYRALEHYGLLG